MNLKESVAGSLADRRTAQKYDFSRAFLLVSITRAMTPPPQGRHVLR